MAGFLIMISIVCTFFSGCTIGMMIGGKSRYQSTELKAYEDCLKKDPVWMKGQSEK
jgi:hypothetical protein